MKSLILSLLTLTYSAFLYAGNVPESITSGSVGFVKASTTTPEDGQDPQLPYELYQIQYIDDEGFIRAKVDNSKLYPVFKQDEPFIVEVSSK